MNLLNKIFDQMIKYFPIAFLLVITFIDIMLVESLIREGGNLPMYLATVFGISVLVSFVYFKYIKKQ